MADPTYRTYLRLPPQQALEKTTTPHRDLALEALRRIVVAHSGETGAAVMTRDGRNEIYLDLATRPWICELCGYMGNFIDGGETCPNCKLVQ